jgi:hypothetical protein
MRTLKCSLKDIHKCKVHCQYTRKFLDFWECPNNGNEFARPLLAEMTKTPRKERKKDRKTENVLDHKIPDIQKQKNNQSIQPKWQRPQRKEGNKN